jgi:endonuclease/exonuclease/phosphatase (EEP) superfamily protein YafD
VVAGARRYPWIWIGVAPVVVWAILRVLGIDSGFPLAAVMPFTPYVAIVALFVAALALALENHAAAALAGLAFLALAALVLPRTIGDGTVDPAGHRTFSVVAANVYEGNADPAALVDLVRDADADALTVEELTPRFARELQATGIGRVLPFEDLAPGADARGTGIYSRRPLTALPVPGTFRFQMTRARLRTAGGGAVRLTAVHPFPPSRPSMVGEWEAGIRSLPAAGRGTPWVLAGDFNATLDQSQLRDLVARGYRDAGDVAGKGLEPTFPQHGFRIPPITIDHVLADERLGVVEYNVEPLPGSDHHAIQATLTLP